MVRRDVIGQKVARASTWLDDADAILSRPEPEFLAEVRDRDLATFYLFLAIQECIDLAAHWIADEGWTPPDDAASAFDVLADRDLIARDVANASRAAVGLRNRIAHGYAGVDHRRLYSEARDGLRCLRRFLATVSIAAGL
jgi:uncharacterized protein YutE (UPF0331/DUF86 family)